MTMWRQDTAENNSRQAGLAKSADFIVHTLRKNPDDHLGTLMKMLASLDPLFSTQGPFGKMMRWIQAHPGTNQSFRKLLSRDPGQLKSFVETFLGCCVLEWMEKAHFLKKKYGFCPPFTILISPTMRNNLSPRGKTADVKPAPDNELDLKALDRIIKGGKEIGVHLYTIVGGEPFLLFDDLSRIAANHRDCLFLIFTNGTCITPDMADQLHEQKNMVPVFRIPGTKEDTDDLFGHGVYEQMLASVSLLKRRSLMYGMSFVLTSKNYDTLTSPEFLDFWEKQGMLFGWNFLFMPEGSDPDLSLMPTPQQRLDIGSFIREYRERHPLFLMDFLTDAPTVHGCIAGGRRLLHITSRGEVEPCIFAHHATHNIHQCTLVEALQSPFFTFIRMNQPHTDNLLRPCMLIDNPEIWRTACTRFKARPTQKGAEALVKNPEITRSLDEYSSVFADLADDLWKTGYGQKIEEMHENKRSYGEGLDRVEFTLSRSEFCDKNRKWARYNPLYAKVMLESLAFSLENYGTDLKRHIQLINKPEPQQASGQRLKDDILS